MKPRRVKKFIGWAMMAGSFLSVVGCCALFDAKRSKILKQRDQWLESVKQSDEFKDSYAKETDEAYKKLDFLSEIHSNAYKKLCAKEISNEEYLEIKLTVDKEIVQVNKRIEYLNSDGFAEGILKYFSFDEILKDYNESENSLNTISNKMACIGGMSFVTIGAGAALTICDFIKDLEKHENEPEC